MRRFLLLVAVMLTAIVSATSQTTVVINTGTAGTPQYNAGPIYRSTAGSAYDASRYAYLYTQAELAAAGIVPGSQITVVGWTKANNATTTGGGIFRIYMKNSSASAFTDATIPWTTLNSGASLVYENLNQNIPATVAPNYITFNLTAPFTYTGGSLEISTEWDINQVAGNPTTDSFDWLWSTVTDRIYGTGQTVLANAGTLSSTSNSISDITDRRPFIQITFVGNTPCTNPPTPGTVVASQNPVCPNVNFQLSLSGTSLGTGQTYQWQSSPDNVNWTNITGGTGFSITVSQNADTYYRAIVTCGASANTPGLLVTTNPVSQCLNYCQSIPTSTADTEIFGVTVNGASNASNCTVVAPGPGSVLNRYSNFRTLGALTTVTPGTNVSFSVSVDDCSGTTYYNSGCAIWIDFNQDGDFLDPGEKVYVDNATSIAPKTVSGTLAIPPSALPGVTGMRVIVAETYSGDGLQPCMTYSFGETEDYMINIATLGPCTNPPTVGTVSASANPACAGTTFTLGISGGTYGSGQTYQWQSSLDNVNWTNIPGGTSTSLSTSQTSDTYYRYQVTCGSTVTSASLLVTTNLCYCTSIPSNVADEEIFSVTVNGNTNTWPCGTVAPGPGSILNRYSNFQSQGPLTTLIPGTSVPFTILQDECDGATYYNNGAAIWIDFNRDGDFLDPGEEVYVEGNTSQGPRTITGNIAVPITAVAGVTGMRIIVAENFSGTGLTPCMTYTYGETEDYFVTIIPPTPCSGTPTGGTATSSQANVCFGESFTLNATGVTQAVGITYQWQSSTDNVNWTNIAGANASSLTTTQSATSYYRLVVTCTNSGGGTSNSTSVQVQTNSLVSGTFTINSALPTSGSNFTSFNDAYDFIKCGIDGPVIFNVNATSGPYNEQLILEPVPGASSTNTITFNGNGRTLTFTSTNTNERATIKFNGADYFTFNDLVITAGGSTTSQYGYGVQFINDADFNTINACTINATQTPATAASTNFAGIVMSASNTSATTTGSTRCDNNTFSNNTITGGYYGITMVGSSTVANGNNKVINNIIREFYSYGVYVNGSFNVLIQGNTISRPARTSVGEFNGVYFTGLSASAEIAKNRITNPFGGAAANTTGFYGIYFTAVDALVGLENVVANNLIYGANGAGVQYGLYNSSSDNVWYFHNTIALDQTTSTSTAVTRGFYQTTQADGIALINNIITISRGGTGAKHVLYFNTATSDIFSNRNDLYISSTAGTNFIGYYSGNSYSLLTSWQTATGDDLNSVRFDPLYTNPAAGNYQPTNASINDRGIYVDIPDDILNIARNTSTPDIGAYEFTPPPCTTPPVAGTATVNQTPVCVNFPVLLSVTGNTSGLTQTYQWQTSGTLAGTYNNLGTVLQNPDTIIDASITQYYRVAITCGASTVYSTPVLVTVTPALPAGTYTINKNLPTGGTNYNSFNAAKAAMSCGIDGPVVFNVVVGSGPYTEQLILDTIPGTSVTNTVTFNGNGETIKFSSTVTDERAVIKMRTTDHVIFDSLVIDATPVGAGTTYGYGIHLMNNADSNTFRKCTILNTTSSNSTNYAGILITSSNTSATTTGLTLCDDNLFDNNIITGGYYGVSAVGISSNLISGNKFTNNTVREFYTYGFYINANDGTIIEGNTITRPTRATPITEFNGVYVTGVSQGLKISKNRIHNPFGAALTSTGGFYGVYITGSDALSTSPNVISNNLIYNTNGAGVVYGFYNSSSNNAHYYHNTIVLDNPSSTSTSVTRGFYQITDAAGIQFKNNIISITRGGTGTKHAVYLSTATTEFFADRNNYYENAGGTNNYLGYYTTNRNDLAAWQAATLQDGNSLTINPDFLNPVGGDYTPGFSAALLDNMGTPVGITTDIRNVTRSTTTPDPGAYEFAIPPCVDPPTPGNATAIPNNNICMGVPISLNLTGNSVGANQTYQWQTSSSVSGPWTNLGSPQTSPALTTPSTFTTYYRAAIQCGSGTVVYSTPVLVTLNPPFAAGTYTIDPSLPASATNFTSFNSAVAALYCGIAGHVVFNAAPVTFVEQVRIGVVPGTSPSATVTFQSNPASPGAVLEFTATSAATNYTLKLDSAQYIFFKNLTINAKDADNGRAIELAKTASYDSIVNCMITVPSTTTTTNEVAGVYADGLTGSNNTIKGNTISGGTSGIYFRGTSAAILTSGNNIDSNTVSGAFQYGIYTSFTDRSKVNKNRVTVNGALGLNTTAYGIYVNNADTSYEVSNNNVTISNSNTAVYGLYLNVSDATLAAQGRVANNRITAITANSGNLWGLAIASSSYANVLNNVISIQTNGANSYGLWSNLASNSRFYNNSVNSTSTSATNNMAAYFNHTSFANGNVNIRNNIFSHKGGGRAYHLTNVNFIYSDYNMFYTTGTNLISVGTTLYTNLQAFRNAYDWDVNSIVYNPAFVSNSDLRPDVASPDVWAIHGRGVQIADNNVDFNGNARPTTLTAGVPDLGAYEFVPTSVPVALVATPATPAPNTTQRFMLGTDTVTTITWGATVPASITGRRYSGMVPPALTAGQPFMYFYTDFDVPAGTYNYTAKQFYIDPWRGFIPAEQQIKLGRTDASNAWIVNTTVSTVDVLANTISEPNLTFLDKLTGLTDGTVAPPVVQVISADSSNAGTKFWVAYGHHYGFGTNSQSMVLYLSAEQAANVQVRVNGTSWVRNYSIGANTAIVSDPLPKTGLSDSRITDEGKFEKGISITSDVPIVAYAHIYDGSNSGAGMLLPVGVYGYEYYSLNSSQYYPTGGAGSYSWFYVIADRDSTAVEITPSVTTKGGRPAGVPFVVYLNRGEVYNVMGTINGAQGTDLTGSKIKSVPNLAGNCYPMAVFSGSSRTAICNTTNGDNLIQQIFPSQAWGRRFLTFATARSTSNTDYNSNRFRVMVKDPTTVVKRDGVTLNAASLVVPGNYYEFSTTAGAGSNAAVYIEADKPVMVAQYMVSTGATQCAGITTAGVGDPEMIYISPIEQGIKKAVFYTTNENAITSNYVNVVIPTAGLTSLTIDGSSTFTHVFPHPSLTGYSSVRHNLGATAGQHIIQSDSAFTAITYGLGTTESYGYNTGTLVKNLLVQSTITNTLATPGTNAPFTCPGAPFRFVATLAVIPTQLVWKLSMVQNLTPNTDVTQVNPTPFNTFVSNGQTFYQFSIPADYTFSAVGQYVVPIYFTHPSVDNCNNTQEATVSVNVIPGPVADYTFTFTGCLSDAAQFTAPATSGTFTLNRWQWDFGDATTSNIQNPTKTWSAPGVYNVALRVISPEGCLGDVTKPVTVNPLPVATVATDSFAICANQTATFAASNIVAGSVYEWFTSATGGTAIFTGQSFTTPALTATTVYYLQVTNSGGCISNPRKRVVAQVYNPLANPVVSVDTAGVFFIRWKWNAVPGATGYQVSTDGGTTWITPSSGAAGLTHTRSGLQPETAYTLQVRATGVIACQTSSSTSSASTTLSDQIFIPNTFTPNADGKNDRWEVYGNVITNVEAMIFNQWGEKIVDVKSGSRTANGSFIIWDGSYKGQQAPVGVYVYVVKLTLENGEVQTKKGSINIIR